jgi:hypothetical protein
MGAKERPPPLPPEGVYLNSRVQKVKTKIKKAAAKRLTEKMSNHSWEEEFKKKQHHLSRFNITDDPATCILCTNGVQDRAHLFECAKLLEDNEDALIQQMMHEEAEAFL